MADLVSFDDLRIGTTISFKTYNGYDSNTWRGIINGIGDYTFAKGMDDLIPYYQNVKKSIPNMPAIENLTFYSMSVYENSLTKTTGKRVFAKEWIDQSSIKIIDMNSHVDFRVFNITASNKQTIIDILSDHGYSCSIIS